MYVSPYQDGIYLLWNVTGNKQLKLEAPTLAHMDVDSWYVRLPISIQIVDVVDLYFKVNDLNREHKEVHTWLSCKRICDFHNTLVILTAVAAKFRSELAMMRLKVRLSDSSQWFSAFALNSFTCSTWLAIAWFTSVGASNSLFEDCTDVNGQPNYSAR